MRFPSRTFASDHDADPVTGDAANRLAAIVSISWLSQSSPPCPSILAPLSASLPPASRPRNHLIFAARTEVRDGVDGDGNRENREQSERERDEKKERDRENE